MAIAVFALENAKSYQCPGGGRGAAKWRCRQFFAIPVCREPPLAAAGAGRVWVNGIDTDTASLFDPRSEKFRVITLPSKNVGIRKAIIDANGPYWYMGSDNGRLGVIE